MERDLMADLELCDKATKSKWKPELIFDHGEDELYWVDGPNYLHDGDFCYHTKEDAEFIAEAREALPYWLRRVQELEAQAAVMREALEKIKHIKPHQHYKWGETLWGVVARSALSTTAGKEMLEYVKKLEAVAEATKNVVDNINLPASKVVKMWLELKEALASLDGDNA